MLAAAKSCAGKWLANSTRWVRCLLNTTTPGKSLPCTHDAHRDGFVIAGGGGMVVVEELETRWRVVLHIYAEIVGYGADL